MKRTFRIFCQEFAFEDSLAGIKAAARLRDRSQRISAIASILPQASPKTKERLAAKIIQRYFGGRRKADAAPHFADLVLRLRDSSVQRELMLYRTARVDRIVGAIAQEIFYPYFVAKTYPKGYNESDFRLANTATLFDSDDVISSRFVQEFARRRWGFNSSSTINLALRVLREGGVLRSVGPRRSPKRSLAYLPTYAGLSPVTFCYCLACEFSLQDSFEAPTRDKVHNADFVKLFLLGPPVVDSILAEARRRGWLRLAGTGSAARVHLAAPTSRELVKLLAKSRRG